MMQILLVSRLVAPFVKVAALVGIAVFVDIQFNLGFTDMAIQAAEEYIKSEITGGWL
jgi:hypothetical protein